MNSRELLRKLRRLALSRGKSLPLARTGAVMSWVRLGGRFAMAPTGSGEIAPRTLRAILRHLGLRPEDLR